MNVDPWLIEAIRQDIQMLGPKEGVFTTVSKAQGTRRKKGRIEKLENRRNVKCFSEPMVTQGDLVKNQ